MTKKTSIIIYIILAIVVVCSIFIIWAIDAGLIASHADIGPSVTSAAQLKSLPNPDQSTFSKLFGAVSKLFGR